MTSLFTDRKARKRRKREKDSEAKRKKRRGIAEAWDRGTITPPGVVERGQRSSSRGCAQKLIANRGKTSAAEIAAGRGKKSEKNEKKGHLLSGL